MRFVYMDREPPEEPNHRVRWTEDGGFCDAGEDCLICEEERRAELGLDDDEEEVDGTGDDTD